MNRLTGTFFIAAMLALAGCGGGSGGDTSAAGSTTDVVSLATKMINEATAEDCPTDQHCYAWPVDSLATVPQDERPTDL